MVSAPYVDGRVYVFHRLTPPPLPALTDNGHTVTVTVRDLCPGCAANSLDLTSSAFQQLAPLSVGNIPVSWSWV